MDTYLAGRIELLNFEINSPDVFGPIDEIQIDVWDRRLNEKNDRRRTLVRRLIGFEKLSTVTLLWSHVDNQLWWIG